MRPHLLAALIALVVLASSTQALAFEEATVAWCVGRPTPVAFASLASRLLSGEKSLAKGPEIVFASASRALVSRVAARSAPLSPQQSRAPSMCADPRQPGCAIRPIDSPHRTHHDPTVTDAGMLRPPFDGVDPPEERSALPRCNAAGAPHDGYARALWRPPTA